MRFSTKRGRPKQNTNHEDKGTIELQEKRSRDLTTEALELCLKRKLISEQEFEAGNRLRWLYTLRFGTPEVQAYDAEKVGRSCSSDHNDDWLKERHDEYDRILTSLEQIGAKKLVINICIFRQRPDFLSRSTTSLKKKSIAQNYNAILKFQQGMQLLTKL